MKRKFLALITIGLALVALILTAGCGGSNSSSTSGTTNQNTGSVSGSAN